MPGLGWFFTQEVGSHRIHRSQKDEELNNRKPVSTIESASQKLKLASDCENYTRGIKVVVILVPTDITD